MGPLWLLFIDVPAEDPYHLGNESKNRFIDRAGAVSDRAGMLSYRHGFHAGNHADVFKHWILAEILAALIKKDKPIFVLDTHAGAGRYDLRSSMALKNAEFSEGIGRLWGQMSEIPGLSGYEAALRTTNPAADLRWYPGSPRLIRHFLRPGDRLVCTELHPKDQLLLKREFEGDARVRIECRDGYEALKALLPPRERRGLVHMDPAYERKDESVRLIAALTEGYRRWATGVYALWYPLQGGHSDLPRRLRRLGIPKMLMAEYRLGGEDPKGLIGSGMILINPPFGVEALLRRDLPPLAARLAQRAVPTHEIAWLTP